MADYIGIDYGLGTTNVDHETGIRFGVISSGEVCQAWSESSEADYGEPHCPKCGNEAVASDSDTPEDKQFDEEGNPNPDASREDLGYKVQSHACGDYACDSCEYLFDGDEAFGDEPVSWFLDDGEYKATQGGDDRDIFILKSPYYTRCAFCSPCAPGAGYITDERENGIKAYCFGHDFFWDSDDKRAPYKVYRVSDDTEVLPDSE